MNTEKATPELFASLAKAQGEIENASKNAANPHFKSKYADLAEVMNTIRPAFSANGLSLVQFPSFDGSMASVTTLIGHSSGGYISAVASCVPAKSDAQGIGSATTYLRRYGAAAAAGIAQEDDDGESAKHNDKPAPIVGQQQKHLAAIASAGSLDELRARFTAANNETKSASDLEAYALAKDIRKAELSPQEKAA